jgi:hypothetical protein
MLFLHLAFAAPNTAATTAAEGGDNPATGDTWLIAAWDWLCGIFGQIAGAANEFACRVLYDDLAVKQLDPVAVIVLLVILTLAILSGCWAAGIAQMRRHNRWLFFLFGCVTFFVGPAILLFKLDINGEKELQATLAAAAAVKAEEEKRKQELLAEARAEHGEAPTEQVADDGTVWNQPFFRSIMRNPDGTPAGPWKVRYNGIDVTVLEIIEPLEAFVQVRMINLEGKEIVGRIPYARLEEWKPAPES